MGRFGLGSRLLLREMAAHRSMKFFFKYLISVLTIAQLIGCASRPSAPTGDSIVVDGFVKHQGRYAYFEGMTVADALSAAGGYGHCSSCEEFYNKNGWHFTFDWPPKVKRGEEFLKLPKNKVEWTKFILQRNDEVKFRHILW